MSGFENSLLSEDSRLARRVSLFLASQPRPHPREVLADLLWDERAQSQALANLRVALSSLRRDFAMISSPLPEESCGSPH